VKTDQGPNRGRWKESTHASNTGPATLTGIGKMQGAEKRIPQ
jgi:hypothetical protein